MRRRIIDIVCLSIFIPMIAHSQFLRGHGFKLGAVSANQEWNYKPNVNLPTEFPTDRRWGIDAGVFLEVLNIPYLSFVAELHYIQKGFSKTLPVTTPTQPDGTGEYITLKPRVDYLSIPVTAKLRLDLEVLTPYFFVGPRLDFLIAKEPEGAQAVLDDFKSTDVGASIGAGLELSVGFVPAGLIEFRYSPSFDDAFSNNILTVKNQSFELLLGMRL